MDIYKLKVLTCSGEGEKSYLTDFFFDVDKIDGFYLPIKDIEDMHIEGEFITICHGSSWTNILQEPHIVKYLTDKFVKNIVTVNS